MLYLRGLRQSGTKSGSKAAPRPKSLGRDKFVVRRASVDGEVEAALTICDDALQYILHSHLDIK